MVLQGAATADSSDGFATDTSPTSDIDPYASSSSSYSSSPLPATSGSRNGGQRYNIKVDQLPQPFFLFNLLGSQQRENDRAMYRTIAQNCNHAREVLQRDLTQDEIDAIGFHFAKSLRIVSYGLPGGAAVGAWWAYKGMADFTFPFWKPAQEAAADAAATGEAGVGAGAAASEGAATAKQQAKKFKRFNPNVFGPFKDVNARALWHGIRFNCYAIVGAIAGTMFFSTYATTVNAVGTGSDPRLKAYIDAVRKRAENARNGVAVQRPVGQRNPIESQEGMMDRQAQVAARRAGVETTYSRGMGDVQRRANDYGGSSSNNRYSDDDDASPTGGAFSSEFSSSSSSTSYHEPGGSPTDSGLLNDEQTERRNSGLHNNSNQDTMAKRAASSPFTDPTSSGSSGSAWDRIRKDASASGPTQSARASAWPSPSSSSPSSSSPSSSSQYQRDQQDSFSFSSAEEEKALAKSEAQREFDARVERERKGGDFVGGESMRASGSGNGESAWERLRK